MKQAALESRRLGPGGFTVSALGLGCMGMSDAYGPTDRAGSIATIRHALDVGVCLLDTADAYGRGHNEELVGAAIGGVRDRAVLATKFGIEVCGDGSRRINGRPEYVRACAEASLRRLGTNVIDVYYQHRVDKAVPIEETVGAMGELVAAGKVRYLGLSQASARSLERASAVHPIAALQTEWSIWTRDLARAHSGDLRTAVADGALAWDDVRHLGAALDGPPARAEPRAEPRAATRPETRPGTGAITVFCSHGVGSWDLELARIALERAEATGTGHRLGLDMGQWRDGQ